jgi:hypothetical protein
MELRISPQFVSPMALPSVFHIQTIQRYARPWPASSALASGLIGCTLNPSRQCHSSERFGETTGFHPFRKNACGPDTSDRRSVVGDKRLETICSSSTASRWVSRSEIFLIKSCHSSIQGYIVDARTLRVGRSNGHSRRGRFSCECYQCWHEGAATDQSFLVTSRASVLRS